MGVMRKTPAAIAAVVATTIAMPAIAVAAIFEIGTVQGENAMPDPACPAKPCLAISRTTGYQVKVGGARDTHVVKEDGRIVAWTIKLSRPGKKQIEFFEKNLGGESTAQLTVLRPGNKLYARILAQGEPVALEPYFGQTAQFALQKSIPVKKGNVIGISVPTWAPALSINQPGTVSWRASRPKGGCNDFAKPTAQLGMNNITRFFCLYRTARLTYTATVVTDPKPASGVETDTSRRRGSRG
ncbi:MAG: hypothetical protein AVDCRST_MAG53-2069 [uncultured Solirubrobacteraceae bacterium]|uniref:Uncharacterized protein n=1 Tax=uncultured Solirubrobacteraceae bacterium TaxID=1162706 RepID=A0A6J4SL55_9ACTN|nr:MAG: hypothetical protein AVDCRST_MAG53-2069 [uncultured Solirubrobacteraceae bacterium]